MGWVVGGDEAGQSSDGEDRGRLRTARRGELVHLTGDQPGIRTRRTAAGVTRHSEPSCTIRKTSRYDSRSGRCSAATAASTSPSNTSSTPKPCGSPNSTNPSPLARRPEPRRHHHDRLARGRARGHSHRRVPLPGRIYCRQARRPRAWHPLRAVGAHGRSHRRAPTRMGRHRERPRAAVLPSDATISRRRPP